MLFLEQTQGFAGDDGSITAAPSLFDLLMQERMAVGLKSAVEYLVHTLCESYPNLAVLLPVRCLDESYALLRCCIESYFLSRYDSLATEKFYGIKRVMIANVNAKATTSPLTPRARKLALFFAVLVPYLKTKLDAYYKATAELLTNTTVASTRNAATDDRREKRMSRFLQCLRSFAYLLTLKKGFVATYPYAHVTYEGSFFLYQWLYLFEDTPFFSPFLKWMKTVLVRVTADDEVMFRQKKMTYRTKVMEKLSGSGIADRVRRFVVRMMWVTVDHSYVLLLMGIAAYKFIEWMYSDEGVSSAKLRSIGTDAPVPPPPLPPQFSDQALALATTDPTFCPLCKQKRANPAMVPSGYVFCYPCIYRYVEQHGECPLTQMKCELATIAKIYDDTRDP